MHDVTFYTTRIGNNFESLVLKFVLVQHLIHLYIYFYNCSHQSIQQLLYDTWSSSVWACDTSNQLNNFCVVNYFICIQRMNGCKPVFLGHHTCGTQQLCLDWIGECNSFEYVLDGFQRCSQSLSRRRMNMKVNLGENYRK